MKRTQLFIFIIFLFTQSKACDYEEMSFLWWYFKSDIICTGEVNYVFESDSASYDIELLIERVYKGEEMDTLRLTVRSYSEGSAVFSDCDRYMRKGEKYLVYAAKSGTNYYVGGQESRTDLVTGIVENKKNDLLWLETVNVKVTDFYWNWNDYDVAPKASNIDSIVQINFNITTVDTATVHGIWAFVLCNIDEKGKLTQSNLFYYKKEDKTETIRKIYEKLEYLNPTTECFTNFQKEAIRVTKMINNWTPSFFCGQKVKSQILLEFAYEKGKIKTEII